MSFFDPIIWKVCSFLWLLLIPFICLALFRCWKSGLLTCLILILVTPKCKSLCIEKRVGDLNIQSCLNSSHLIKFSVRSNGSYTTPVYWNGTCWKPPIFKRDDLSVGDRECPSMPSDCFKGNKTNATVTNLCFCSYNISSMIESYILNHTLSGNCSKPYAVVKKGEIKDGIKWDKNIKFYKTCNKGDGDRSGHRRCRPGKSYSRRVEDSRPGVYSPLARRKRAIPVVVGAVLGAGAGAVTGYLTSSSNDDYDLTDLIKWLKDLEKVVKKLETNQKSIINVIGGDEHDLHTILYYLNMSVTSGGFCKHGKGISKIHHKSDDDDNHESCENIENLGHDFDDLEKGLDDLQDKEINRLSKNRIKQAFNETKFQLIFLFLAFVVLWLLGSWAKKTYKHHNHYDGECPFPHFPNPKTDSCSCGKCFTGKKEYTFCNNL